jgi:hypothetical protein
MVIMGVPVRRQILVRLCVLGGALAALAACTTPKSSAETPGLVERGTTMTTVKPTRQDLSNKLSLSGKVGLSPVFGLVSPVNGQVRFLDVKPPTSTPTKPTKVANIWSGGKAVPVEVPAGSVFAGRLVDDRSTVTAGMPIVSARHAGYGITADIDGGQAYKISESLATVQAQIKNGPGPFPCTVLGTIAALPAGTIPEPPPPTAQPSTPPTAPPVVSKEGQGNNPSDATGMRLVCTAPADVKLINGATATLEVITERAANVLVLPVEAVAGGQGKGKVDVVKTDRTRETRDVVLGLTDGKMIEIKSGLNGDEEIAVPGPNIPPAKQDPNQGPGGPIGPGK